MRGWRACCVGEDGALELLEGVAARGVDVGRSRQAERIVKDLKDGRGVVGKDNDNRRDALKSRRTYCSRVAR